jgi:hypothetical protein
MQRDARDEGESARDGQGHGPVDGPRSRSRSEKREAAVARMRTAGWRAEGTSLYVQQRRRDRVGARREKQNGAGCCFVSLFVYRSLFVTVSEERGPVGADGAGTWQPRARHRADTCAAARESRRGPGRPAIERLARLIASAVLSCNRREAEKLMLFASTYPGGARRRLTLRR